MAPLDHWKNYAPVDGVLVFDERRDRPGRGAVRVIANVSSNPAYGADRVVVCIADLASTVLTVAQSRALREVLERAERDAGAVLSATPATGAEGHCENCSRPIQACEMVHVYDDATVHAGTCPDTTAPLGEERGDG